MIYQDGNAELALVIRNLEKKVGRAREDVQDPKTGVPPYITDLKISRGLWEDLLDYDERLLVRMSALNADVQTLQQDTANGTLNQERLNKIENVLDAFLFHFRNRSQTLRASEKEIQAYRLK